MIDRDWGDFLGFLALCALGYAVIVLGFAG